jgi:hypothetical protein
VSCGAPNIIRIARPVSVNETRCFRSFLCAFVSSHSNSMAAVASQARF